MYRFATLQFTRLSDNIRVIIIVVSFNPRRKAHMLRSVFLELSLPYANINKLSPVLVNRVNTIKAVNVFVDGAERIFRPRQSEFAHVHRLNPHGETALFIETYARCPNVNRSRVRCVALRALRLRVLRRVA